MTHWTITALRLGELYLPHGGGIMRDPVHCWLVRGGGVNMLVDSGMADITLIRDRLKVDGFGGGHPALRAELAKDDKDAEELDAKMNDLNLSLMKVGEKIYGGTEGAPPGPDGMGGPDGAAPAGEPAGEPEDEGETVEGEFREV